MKKALMITLCVFLIMIAGFGVGGWVLMGRLETQKAEQAEYAASHVTVNGTDFRKDAAAVDLSGSPLTDWSGLTRMEKLEQVDLRDTGMDDATYEAIKAALPDCEILWSVPFQNTYLAEDTRNLEISTLCMEDLDALAYLPQLESVNAGSCTDYEALSGLVQRYPQVELHYTINLGGADYPYDTTDLVLTDPDAEQLEQALAYFPQLHYVSLSGNLPESDTLAALQRRYPDIAIEWHFAALGKVFSSLDTFVDLSGIPMDSTDELEHILPWFRNLQQVDMVDCGLSSEVMDAANRRWPSTKLVWQVNVGGKQLRTDAKVYMPVKYKIKELEDYQISEIRYCHDLVMLDLGHYGVKDLTFLRELPNLEYLLLCQIYLSDTSPIGSCSKLKCLELFGTNCQDLWPLVNLTNLKDLNISDSPCTMRITDIYAEYGHFPDVTPLLQMTWLDRLWMSKCLFNKAERNLICENLPDTYKVFHNPSATGGGWRHMPTYYQQRDLAQMQYMVG